MAAVVAAVAVQRAALGGPALSMATLGGSARGSDGHEHHARVLEHAARPLDRSPRLGVRHAEHTIVRVVLEVEQPVEVVCELVAVGDPVSYTHLTLPTI